MSSVCLNSVGDEVWLVLVHFGWFCFVLVDFVLALLVLVEFDRFFGLCLVEKGLVWFSSVWFGRI